ncbi:HWE histidine kinase domain-containing protein [uncultured Roseobacter sp.]|uniref:HWE histidine kinase domain-containing protein n=1 Tax=uncultured Roseobacter sp. TaxID=114847 RepID=UPI002604EC0A|nr:HWE histidine kinase domain-containing protein [uncultured Roseobacter sp.]
MKGLTDAELAEALETCAAEPIHIPGSVQAFGAIVAADSDTSVITHASENSADVLGIRAAELLGTKLDSFVGKDIWHALQNALSRASIVSRPALLGDFSIGNHMATVRAFKVAGTVVLEFEKCQQTVFSGPEGLQTLRMFMDNIESATDETLLFSLTVDLLRHITGYNRVMIYRFDHEFNGEVLAENRRSNMQSFEGLHFPHWDIPAQARALMEKLPLRVIEDAGQGHIPLRALSADLEPLDLTLAATRGASPLHLEYLRNMGSQATMTLTVKVDGKLWGIISFHHEKPRAPVPALREVLISIAQVFSAKLQVFQQQARLALVSRVDSLKDDALLDSDVESGVTAFLASVLKTLDADGVIIVRDDVVRQLGQVPDPELIAALKSSTGDPQTVRSFNALSESFPSHDHARNGCAGAIVFGPEENQWLLVFRNEIEQQISWAGNPEKTVETVDDRLRLSPRGSFATYLEQVRGHAEAWRDQDLYFASRLWAVVNTIERRELITSLNRQQNMMIQELNHRVRNILALVRSVSKQAQQSSYGSLNSYARALEARIYALAASHELASTSLNAVVGIEELVAREFKPFDEGAKNRYTISGAQKSFRAEVAPIFSLVVHELVTNAVKYGALSNEAGTVAADFRQDDGGLIMEWTEQGGPPVREPDELGFGSSLIKQAVPYELDGDAELIFRETGIYARFFLPAKLFDQSAKHVLSDEPDAVQTAYDAQAFLDAASGATCLIVEDNYMIARATQDDLLSFGVRECERVNDLEGAFDYLSSVRPTFAILDFNLSDGETSFPVAQFLQEADIPFFFVTGYGEDESTPIAFRSAVKLVKPVPVDLLKSTVARMLLE